MLDALWIAVIGMGTVFLVLAINFVLVVLIGRFGRERLPVAQSVQAVEPVAAAGVSAEPEPEPEPTADAAPVQAEPLAGKQPRNSEMATNDADDTRLHAAIAAAIRAYEEEIAVSRG